jgi:hypothetical protein
MEENFNGHRPQFSDGQEDYVDAIYALAELICKDDPELMKLTMKFQGGSLDEYMDSIWHMKADLIRLYTQKAFRGGMN